MTGNDHALEDADPLELAEIKRRWKPYIDQLPEYAYLCDELLKRSKVTYPQTSVRSHKMCFWHLFCGFFVNLIKKSLTICLWKDRKVHPDLRRRPSGCVQFKTDRQSDLYR